VIDLTDSLNTKTITADGKTIKYRAIYNRIYRCEPTVNIVEVDPTTGEALPYVGDLAYQEPALSGGSNISVPLYDQKTGTYTFGYPVLPVGNHNFRITAINDGGESFPSETLSACHHEDDTKRILIVNAFNRLSAPAIVDNDSIQGFLLDEDMGVSYGLTAGWSGRQISFDRSRIGSESETGLGYSGNEMAGLFVMGNTFDYPTVHVEAIRQAGNYQVSSCSVGALLAGQVDMKAYDCVDIIMGLQRNTPHATRYFKTFTPQLQKLITEYSQHGGALLVSGSYLGSDMKEPGEQAFMQNVLKVMPDTTIAFTSPNNVNGLGLQFDVYSQPNDKHYSISSPDALLPIADAICAMQFDDGRSAAVAYKGQRFSSFTMAFPFECIISESMRQKIMDGILNYLIK